MEYIKAEEFLKQPVEVQKVLKQHWIENVSSGDLYETDVCETLECVDFIENDNIFSITNDIFGENDIPLLTEGHLRQFIEDKTESKLETMYIEGYSIRLSRNNPNGKNIIFSKRFLEKDLIKSYWKVAIEIAKEGIE